MFDFLRCEKHFFQMLRRFFCFEVHCSHHFSSLTSSLISHVLSLSLLLSPFHFRCLISASSLYPFVVVSFSVLCCRCRWLLPGCCCCCWFAALLLLVLRCYPLRGNFSRYCCRMCSAVTQAIAE